MNMFDNRRKRRISSEIQPSPTATEQAALYSTPKSDNPVESMAAEADLIAARSIMMRVPLLAQLEVAQLDAILNEGRVATYEAGDVLISEGDIGGSPGLDFFK